MLIDCYQYHTNEDSPEYHKPQTDHTNEYTSVGLLASFVGVALCIK